MYEVTIQTGDMYAYRFSFTFLKDANEFINMALSHACDDIEVLIVRSYKEDNK